MSGTGARIDQCHFANERTGADYGQALDLFGFRLYTDDFKLAALD